MANDLCTKAAIENSARSRAAGIGRWISLLDSLLDARRFGTWLPIFSHEQRQGRIHRYAGFATRPAIAQQLGPAALAGATPHAIRGVDVGKGPNQIWRTDPA
jgi:hypothetical protein